MALAVGVTLLVASLGRSRGWTPVAGFVPERAFSIWTFAEAVGLVPTFGYIAALFVLWSLSVEYAWYALLGLFIRPVQRWPVGTTVAITAVLVVLHEIAPSTKSRPQLIRDHLIYVFVVLIGRWIYLRHTGRTSTLMAVGGGLGTAAIVAALQWSSPAGPALFGGGKPRMLSLAWAVLALSLLIKFVRRGPWKLVSFVADISYGLYLFHIPAMWLVLRVVSPGGRLFPVGVILTLALTVAAAWLSHRYVETPIRLWVRALLGRRKDPLLEETKRPVAQPTR